MDVHSISRPCLYPGEPFIFEMKATVSPLGEKLGDQQAPILAIIATDVSMIFFSSKEKTSNPIHVRDAIDIQRIMVIVWLAAFPAMFFGMYNIGDQTLEYLSLIGSTNSNDWHHQIINLIGYNNSWTNKLWIGAIYFMPIYIVTFTVGILWELLFAVIRKHEINEGFFVSSILFALSCPPDLPLWQAAMGITFGIVIGKEIFGGTGYNIFNPALVARAFVFFAYPAQISGDLVWKIDGISAATPLATAASIQGDTALNLLSGKYTFENMFYGFIPGSIGETSTIACLIGGIFLLITRIANWRVMFGVVLGMIVTSYLTNLIAPFSTNSMLSLPLHYHFVMGGFAFGLVFMATEPVTAAHTHKGRWIYGFLIGFMCIIIRAINPAYPEGMMLAILFANAFAPLFDYSVVQSHIKKRQLSYEE